MRLKILNAIIYSFILLTFVGCLSSDLKAQNEDSLKQIETIEVAENLVFCEQMVPRKCLYVKRGGKEDFAPLWDQIENFAYIEGYKYVLKVEVEKISRPPKDTSGFKYYLKEIVKREKVESQDETANLYASKWYLSRVKGEKIKEDSNAFLVFEKNKGTFYGNTGCNSVSGKFQIEGDSISFSSMRQTKRACPDMQKIETPFMANFNSADKIKAEVDRLYFYKNGVVVLEFVSNWER